MAGYGNVLLQGVLGAVSGGAGSLVHDMDLDRKKQDAMDLERRKGEMAQKRLKFLDDLKRSNEAETRQRSADFYRQNKLPPEEIPGEEVDEQGNKIGDITAVSDPSRRAQAEHYASKSLLTGDKGIIESARGEAKDVRAEDELKRRTALDEMKAANEGKRLSLTEERDARRADAQDEANRIADKKADAMLARMARGETTGRDTAQIKNARMAADVLFGGDMKRGMQFAFGSADKPPSYKEVLEVAKSIQESEYKKFGRDPEGAMKEAEQRIETYRQKFSGARGGVKADGGEKVGGEKTEAKAETKAAPKEASKPKSKAEYDALPSGALYVNPKDGKTYRKP